MTTSENPYNLVRECLSHFAGRGWKDTASLNQTAARVVKTLAAKHHGFDRGVWLRELNAVAAKAAHYGTCIKPDTIDMGLLTRYSMVEPGVVQRAEAF